MALSNEAFEIVLGLEKKFMDNEDIILGPNPIRWTRAIKAVASNETFQLDLHRGSFEIKKFSLNKRFRSSTVLIRYCSLGTHTNPPEADGKVFNGPHVHLYREGLDDRWAFEVSKIGLEGTESIDTILRQILAYCNVKEPPPIRLNLFDQLT